MKPLTLGLAAAIALSSAALSSGANAAKTESPLLAPIHQFIDAFDRGDMAAAGATHAADVTIIDEVPPHLWRGPKAFETWAKDLGAEGQRLGQSENAVTLGKTLRAVTSGSHGYVVVQATYTYKEKGVAMREPAEMTFALQNGKDGWKITAWSWDGTVPKAVPAAAAAPAPK
jgi:ketosteroid isomerase-like protein